MPMKMKICPCCDQPIEGIYCKGCRKIVWKPIEQEVDYYLNRRHPEFEHACTYHDVEVRKSAKRMTAHEMEAKKDEIRTRMMQKAQGVKPASQMTQRKPTVNTAAKTKPNSNVGQARKKMITMVVTAIVIFMMFFTFVMIGVINTLNESIYGNWGTPIPEPMATAPAIDTSRVDIPGLNVNNSPELPVPMETDPEYKEDWELTDREVCEIGVACNGYGHFSAIFEDVSEVLFGYIRDAGYEWNLDVYSYNQFSDEFTWYETIYEFTIRKEGEYAGFMNVDVDTATGEIHGVELYTEYEKGFFEMADITMKFLEKIGAAENLPAGAEFFEAAYKAQGDGGVCLQYGLEVVCSAPDDEFDIYQMRIHAPGYYTVVE